MRNTLINTAITRKAALSLAILVSFCLMFAVSCGSNTQPPSGALPILKVGDTWTMKSSYYEVEGTTVKTVAGEQVYNGIDCYTITRQLSIQGTSTIDTATIVVDKTTLYTIGFEFTNSINGTAYPETVNNSYTYSVKPYPLSVGKTWAVTINTTDTSLKPGQNQTITETYRYTYEVEKMESITVPAGKFQCFKIVQYDNNNSVVNTRWVTDVTGVSAAKEINNASGIITELISYSLSK
jgi:hypothetical protein